MNLFKKIYHFLSSVKLAIPVMLSLLIASVAGTLYESKFNAEYANIVVYKTWWFLAILFFLFINILFATFTRLPWKKRHLGFLVTHLGMLLLLVGSVLTMNFGIDGTMQIMEGGDSNLVFLQNNVLEIDRKIIPIKRYIDKYNIADNKEINSTEYKFVQYLPFVDVPEKSFSKGTNINFKIKSPFFDVIQVLNDVEEREVQMGPATFRIVAQTDEVSTQKNAPKRGSNSKNVKEVKDILLIKSLDGKIIAELDIKNKTNVSFKDIKIEIINKFRNAQIVNNKIQDGDPANSNPALELKIIKGKESAREIIYQNIPSFTLNSNGVFGYAFGMNSAGNQAEPAGGMPSGGMKDTRPVDNSNLPPNHPHIGTMNKMGASAGALDRMRNTVEFRIIDSQKNIVEVSLYKENKLLDQKILKKDEMLVTPWMGIELTFKGVNSANTEIDPTPTEPKRKMPLPPSAILMKYGNNQSKWLIENSETQISNNGTNASTIYYGRERLFLPFSLFLERFEKKDYPGSEMAMNFRSFVKINSRGETKEIYMNEPLKFEGYTFYQSSYQLNPNSPAITVLSVNRDPGRVLKYLGSIIMCLGIILYTFQKSRRFSKFLN